MTVTYPFAKTFPWALYTMAERGPRLLGRFRTEAEAVDELLRMPDDDQVDAWVEEVEVPTPNNVGYGGLI